MYAIPFRMLMVQTGSSHIIAHLIAVLAVNMLLPIF